MFFKHFQLRFFAIVFSSPRWPPRFLQRFSSPFSFSFPPSAFYRWLSASKKTYQIVCISLYHTVHTNSGPFVINLTSLVVVVNVHELKFHILVFLVTVDLSFFHSNSFTVSSSISTTSQIFSALPLGPIWLKLIILL